MEITINDLKTGNILPIYGNTKTLPSNKGALLIL